MNTDLMFSSKTGKWDTPQKLIDDLSTVFTWDLDVCASRPNVCQTYFNEQQNGLAQDWNLYPLRWMNPVYGRTISQWMNKARATKAGTTVCLVPARTDTAFFHTNAKASSMIVFIKGRLVFGSKESWITRHQETILSPKSKQKSVLNAIKKIGGLLCEKITRDYVYALWSQVELKYSYDHWLICDHLLKDAAPFPSAFVVFGAITQKQRDKLESYGLPMLQKSRPSE